MNYKEEAMKEYVGTQITPSLRYVYIYDQPFSGMDIQCLRAEDVM
jgi:hypothetical protein